jgi:hypothetical protein
VEAMMWTLTSTVFSNNEFVSVEAEDWPSALLAGLAEGCVPEGCVPEGCVPEGCVPEGCVPEGCVPEGCVPEGCVPESCVPDGRVPYVLSHLGCEIGTDRTVIVEEQLSKKVFLVRPAAGARGLAADDASEAGQGPAFTHGDVGALGIESRMFLVFEGMQELLGVGDRNEAKEVVSALAMRLIPCDSCCCWFGASSGGIIGLSIKTGAVIRVFDQSGIGTENVLCAPIQLEGQGFGAIELQGNTRPERFSPADAEVLSYIATSFAERLRSYHNL